MPKIDKCIQTDDEWMKIDGEKELSDIWYDVGRDNHADKRRNTINGRAKMILRVNQRSRLPAIY